MKRQISATLMTCVAAAVLTACGGGGSNGNSPAVNVTISSVTPDRLMYGQKTRFTVVGSNLNQGLSMSSSTCANIAQEAGGNSSTQVFTCNPDTVGTMQLNFVVSGTSVGTVQQNVPAPQVTMKTTMGDMVYELYPNNAPVSVKNFLQYVNEGFYTNLIFHRVIGTFVIQAGGYDSALVEKTTRAPIKLESKNGLSNLRGTLAYARTNVPNSATSQFFINVVDNVRLDGTAAGVDGYAVFGKVVTGLEVMDAIKGVSTKTVGEFGDVPVTPIVITSATQTK